MKTIDYILRYNLSEEEIEALKSCWIINWCWGEWSFSFDKFIENNIEYIPYFDNDKKQELLCDLKRICYEHDLEYRLHYGFTRANWSMCNKVRKLLYWITPFKRIWIVILLFAMLQRHWKDFYNK